MARNAVARSTRARARVSFHRWAAAGVAATAPAMQQSSVTAAVRGFNLIDQSYVERGTPVTFEDFAHRARAGGLIPVRSEILLDLDSPVAAFAKMRRGSFAFLLES